MSSSRRSDFSNHPEFDENKFRELVDSDNEETLLVPPHIEQALQPIDHEAILSTKPGRKTALDADLKYSTRAGKVKIDLESSGRFETPAVVYFSDYDVEDVTSLAVSREEDLLENLLTILEKQKDKTDNYKIGQLLLEEFYEIMLGIKMQFNTITHNHSWLCRCQSDLPEHRQKLSKMEIDLTKIKYVSIEEADDKLREKYAKIINEFSDEDFAKYVTRKYGQLIPTSKEVEINNIKIQEPLLVKEEDKDIFFKFPRIDDLVVATREANKRFNWQIRKIKNQFSAGQPEDMYEKNIKEEVEKLQLEKAKYGILVSKANSLISVNGVEFKSLDQKIEAYSKFKRSTLMKLSALIDMAQFGVQHEFELKCNLCGRTERRALQRAINPLEFIPFDDNSESDSSGELRKHSEFDIFFGVAPL